MKKKSWNKKSSNSNRKKCSVHGGVIKGKVHYWNKQPMCLNCYTRFCTKVRLVKPEKKKTFLERLFGV